MQVFTTKRNAFSTLEQSHAVRVQRILFIFLPAILIQLSACKKEVSVPQSPISQDLSQNTEISLLAKNSGNGMTMTEIPFSATAVIISCWGENIRFSGTIENHVKVTTTPNGNHYTRQFVAKGMTGVGVNAQGQLTGTTYTVIGGSEMFSIKDAVFNPTSGALDLTKSLQESDIVIHRGILVFENVVTGEKVIASHDILKVPGQGLVNNTWHCRGQK